MTMIFQIFSVVMGFGFLVFIHELGHFLAAKMCKIKIMVFAFGFGPNLIKYTFKGTEYCIKAVPFGGFVKMVGEVSDELTGSDGEYSSLVWYKKVWISFAGPLSNYVLAVSLFSFIFSIWGVTTPATGCSIGSVVENYPAAVAGLMPGDKIKSVDAVEISTWSDLNNKLRGKAGKYVSFVIERKGNSFGLNMLVVEKPVTKAATIGIHPVRTKISFIKSLYFGVKTSVLQIVLSVAYLVDRVVSFEKPDISGPIGIFQLMANATKEGLQDYLTLITVLSVALGLFNLFPIPMVDGGMILLFFVEGIVRKQISAKIIRTYNTLGLIFIGGILLFATYSDLLRLNTMMLFSKF
ncbi:MAG: M50 family metallopeptidase [Endomicrobium sp.]|jgi:regulator of sigma E protease|nr:M50 family metallopeptidase [Endomicrobium sp.]